MSQYQDPIITAYFELFKTGGLQVKEMFQGEPFKIPASQLPAIFIAKTSTTAQALNNAEDEHEASYRITLVTDVRQELSETKEVVAGVSKLMEIMEGRNADMTLTTNSLLHILRNNINVNASTKLRTDLRTSTTIDYSDSINRREQDWFIESHIDFVAHFIQVR